MKNIVTNEIEALILRHRLLDRLDGRADIVMPEAVPPLLARQIGRYLVAGLDYPGEPGADGWSVPTGGRYVKLCFSPLVEVDVDTADARQPYQLPLTIEDYLGYVEAITGLSLACDDALMDLFRFTPGWLFDATATMRAECPQAWTLLLSNEFALACRLWPELRLIVERSPFRHGLLHGFLILAELERAHLIMRHVARARAIVGRPDFVEVLRADRPLSSWFSPSDLQEVHRWLAYACFSSGALREFVMGCTAREITGLPAGYPLWAAARGTMPGPAREFGDHPQVRAIMARVFALPPLPPPENGNADAPVERKRPMLRDHILLRWYGQTNAVLPLIALDGVRDVYPTKRVPNLARPAGRAATSTRPQLVALASAMRASADPDMQAALVAASTTYSEGSRRFAGAEVALDANRKLALRMARLHLPPRGRGGSGARFDPTMWLTPMRDAEFWRMFIDIRRGGRLYRSPHARHRTMMRRSLGIVRRAFGPAFAQASWSNETARIVCDLACAIGPISANPQIAYAIQQLERKPGIQRQLGITRRAGYGRGKGRQATARIAVRDE
ncbi:hypothetical protein [uncultured Sphingomonas sp.]|uniref:hypothetical protein n=1 Tax=uncultured Sphingomonas sp. TaxID=158754 RepID=UPI00374A3B2C